MRIEHVKSHTGVRGSEAADRVAALGAQIEDGHRMMEREMAKSQHSRTRSSRTTAK